MESTLFSHREKELKYLARDSANAAAEASLMQQHVRQQFEFQSQCWAKLIRDAVGSWQFWNKWIRRQALTVTALHFAGSVVENGIICLQERGIIIIDNIYKCVCASLNITIFVVVVNEPEGTMCRALTATFNYTLFNINNPGPIFNQPQWMCRCVDVCIFVHVWW